MVNMDYPQASVVIIGQLGFNSFWVGIVAFILALFIWKGNKNAIFSLLLLEA
jgi:hypothetical protein